VKNEKVNEGIEQILVADMIDLIGSRDSSINTDKKGGKNEKT